MKALRASHGEVRNRSKLQPAKAAFLPVHRKFGGA